MKEKDGCRTFYRPIRIGMILPNSFFEQMIIWIETESREQKVLIEKIHNIKLHIRELKNLTARGTVSQFFAELREKTEIHEIIVFSSEHEMGIEI